jgi:hypothetical protein
MLIVVAHTAKCQLISTTSAVVYLRLEKRDEERRKYGSIETVGVDEAIHLQICRQNFEK